MSNSNLDELIEFLKKYEMTISALYDQFARNLPQAADKWQAFAKEEQLHAKWANQLYEYMKAGKLSAEETHFTVQSTKTAIAYIESQIEKVKNDKPDLRKSINIALNIEKSLLESAFFKVFNLDEPKADKIRTRLIEATKAHLTRLTEWHSNTD